MKVVCVPKIITMKIHITMIVVAIGKRSGMG